MAFSITIPGPKLIDLDLSSKLGDLGTTFRQNRDEAYVKDIFANLDLSDPAQVDRAVTQLAHLPQYAGLAQRIAESHQRAQERMATEDIQRGTLGVAQERLGMEKAREQRSQDFMRQLPDMLRGGAGGAAPAATPTAPVIPPYPGTEPDVPDDVSSARRLTPAAPAEPVLPEEAGVDISSAKKQPAAAQGSFEALSTRQLELLAANPDAPKEVNDLAKMYLLQRQKDAAKEKDPIEKEAESFATARGKDFQEELGSLYRRGRDSLGEERTLLRQKALIEKQGLVTGPGVPKLVTGGAKLDVGLLDSLKSMGFPVESTPLLGRYAEWARGRVQAAEQFESLTAEGVFKKAGGSFSRITDKDREQIEKMYSRVANTTEGNLALIDYNLHMNRLDRKEAQEVQNYMRYQAKNGLRPNVEDVERLRSRIQAQGAKELLEHAARDRVRLGGGAAPTPDKKSEPTAIPSPATPTTPNAEGWTPLPGGGRIRIKP